ncbi:MAG: hypothetical protein HZA50_00240 [Planctomycetes bacterium]|nr:hypothetical protein [Planctomycetota bacterium]
MKHEDQIRELLRLIPQSDAETIRRYHEFLKTARKLRGGKKGYNLACPGEQRPVVSGEADAKDSRTIDLSYLRSI